MNEKIGNKVKELLEQNQQMQTELAEAAGVSQAFISNVIKGYRTPSLEVTKRIADFFKITVDELIG